jgi:hypothetical protein
MSNRPWTDDELKQLAAIVAAGGTAFRASANSIENGNLSRSSAFYGHALRAAVHQATEDVGEVCGCRERVGAVVHKFIEARALHADIDVGV